MPHLFPTGQGFVHEYPTAEIDVDDETAEMLLAYHPPIFSLEPTGWPPAVEPAEGGDVPVNGPVETLIGERGPEFIVPPGTTPTDATKAPQDARGLPIPSPRSRRWSLA